MGHFQGNQRDLTAPGQVMRQCWVRWAALQLIIPLLAAGQCYVGPGILPGAGSIDLCASDEDQVGHRTLAVTGSEVYLALKDPGWVCLRDYTTAGIFNFPFHFLSFKMSFRVVHLFL